jgi:hypothetical protein
VASTPRAVPEGGVGGSVEQSGEQEEPTAGVIPGEQKSCDGYLPVPSNRQRRGEIRHVTSRLELRDDVAPAKQTSSGLFIHPSRQ